MARETVVDLRDVGQKTLRNGGISQLQTVLGLRKTEELGGDWWSRLWSPTLRNEDGPRQGMHVTRSYKGAEVLIVRAIYLLFSRNAKKIHTSVHFNTWFCTSCIFLCPLVA